MGCNTSTARSPRGKLGPRPNLEDQQTHLLSVTLQSRTQGVVTASNEKCQTLDRNCATICVWQSRVQGSMFKAVHCAKFSTCPRTDPLHVTRSCHTQTFTCNLHSQLADGHPLNPVASCSKTQQQGRRVASRRTAAHKTSSSISQHAYSVLPEDQTHEQAHSGELLKQGPVLASQQHQEQQVHKQQRSAQTMTCRRCYQRFSTADNSSTSCSFHPAMYTGGEVAKVRTPEFYDLPKLQLHVGSGRCLGLMQLQ